MHAKRYEAKLMVVHVLHRMPKDYQFLIVAMTPVQIYEALKKRAEQKMARLADQCYRRGSSILVRGE